MKQALRTPAVSGVLQKLFRESQLRQVLLEEDEDHGRVVRAFQSAVKRAHRNDVVLVPPGDYPAPDLHRQVAIRAMRPGSVRFIGRPGQPVVSVANGIAAWISGVVMVPHSADLPAVRLRRGLLILTDCRIQGGLEAHGGDSFLYLQGTAFGHTATGLEVADHASAELCGAAVTGCQVGISLVNESKLVVLHSRIEKSAGPAISEPGAGLHAEHSSLYVAGTHICDNQIGLHLTKCPPVEVVACRFEDNELADVMASENGTLHLHGCGFAAQRSDSYAHITLEGTDAVVDACKIDESSAPGIQANGGTIRRQDAPSPAEPDPTDPFSMVISRIQNLVGHDDAKPHLENIIHQAFAALKRREQGLPVLPQRYHMIFEGGVGTGRREVARILAETLVTLKVLTDATLFEARMEDLMFGTVEPGALADSAGGRILMIHAAEEIDRRDVRMTFAREREVLHALLDACGPDTILIFAGERDLVRPVMRNASETERLFHAVLRFPLPSPPDLARMFEARCREQKIALTTKATTKLLLTMHILDDRRDRRFLNAQGVAKLFETAQKRYLERCSRERNFELPVEPCDIDSPVDKNVESLLEAHPAFVSICPKCGAEVPWLPGLPVFTACPVCGHIWASRWGVWTASSHYRRLHTSEEAPASAGIPPLRRRAVGMA